ncbi:twin-arginine translocation pathway signal [Actinomycetospora cinnamomea]|uniref:twin-arginine translocation pathway signal n=1 Tax=Actinomycetospora cinnamomea TaxID=663609 RepID=UPI000E3101FA|nr:twin-arginine translocation pathway signal [Actinomycetospora cinnamomea]
MPATRTRPHPAAVGAVLLLVAMIAAALWRSDESGTGARDEGSTGGAGAAGPAAAATVGPGSTCTPTLTNPGGRNNYRPDAPRDVPLGRGLEITGVVRDTLCRPLPGVPVQVWLQTASGSERENRTTVLTDADGRYRVETDPAVSQFGEPNVHVAHDAEGPWRDVFQRHVVDTDDTLAVVDLVLVPAS